MKKQLQLLLKNKLTEKQLSLLPSSYDMIGDILIFSDISKELLKKEKIIGEALLTLHKNINVIIKKTKKFSGKYRLPKLKVIAGEDRKETIHKENSVKLKLNVEKVYFSPRLSTERKRINLLVKPNESVLVMFSGCGVYPVNISKNTQAKEIYGIEINPIAHRYAVENLKLNRANNVKLSLGDVKKKIPKLNKKFDRILMPLPKDAGDFLKSAFAVTKKRAIIHFYTFGQEKEFENIKKKLIDKCEKLGKKIKILNLVRCGQYSPYTYRICIDFRIL